MYRTTIQSISPKVLAYSLAFTLAAFPVVSTTQALARRLLHPLRLLWLQRLMLQSNTGLTPGLTRITCASMEAKPFKNTYHSSLAQVTDLPSETMSRIVDKAL